VQEKRREERERRGEHVMFYQNMIKREREGSLLSRIYILET
jgi:hypothetical protein